MSKTRVKYFLLWLGIFYFEVTEAQIINQEFKKHHFGFDAACNYNILIGKKYFSAEICDSIYASNPPSSDPPAYVKFVGYRLKNNFSYKVGLNYSLQINKWFLIRTGFQYFLRRTVLEANPDSVISYGAYKEPFPLRWSISFNSLEVPLFFSIMSGPLNFAFGINYNLVGVSYEKKYFQNGEITSKNISDNTFPNQKRWRLANENHFFSLRMPLRFHPEVQIGYTFRFRSFYPQVNVRLGFRSFNELDFQFGFTMPFLNLK